ncbi:MAG: DUF4340 domain-containing protein [Elusimicrobiales bacterium]|nr:DUF4340 domain-containing protein [Elusimicrobiales bacterium]
MNKNHIRIFIIIGLVLSFLIVKNIYEPDIYSNEELNKFILVKEIKKIEFFNEKESIILEKKTNEWYMTNPYNWKAEQALIQQIINKLDNTKMYGPLCEDEKLFNKFEINEKSLKVNLISDRNFSFIIGKDGSSFNSIFIKPTNKTGIYELNGISSFDIKKEAKEFLYKKIFFLNDEEIEKIKIIYNSKEINLSKNANTWDSEKSKKIYEKLKEINFSDIEKKQIHKLKPLIEISITAKSNISIFKIYTEKNKYIMETNDLTFKFDEFDSKKINELKDLLKN